MFGSFSCAVCCSINLFPVVKASSVVGWAGGSAAAAGETAVHDVAGPTFPFDLASIASL